MASRKSRIIEEILKRAHERGVSEERFWSMVHSKIEELGRLIDEETAAIMVAHSLGIKIQKEDYKLDSIQIADIVEGLSRLEITGRVVDIDPVMVFFKNGREYQLAKLLIGDGTGLATVTLWPPHVQLVKDGTLRVGDCIRVLNGKTKKYRGRIEISVDARSKIEIVDDVPSIPPLEELVKEKITSIENAKVIKVVHPIQVKTKWGFRKVSLIECIKNAETRRELLRIFAWGRKAEWSKHISAGDIITVYGVLAEKRNFRIRTTLVRELHTGKFFSLVRTGKEEIAEARFNPDELQGLEGKFFTIDLTGKFCVIMPRRNDLRILVAGRRKIADITIRHKKVKEVFLKNYLSYLGYNIILQNLEFSSTDGGLTTSLWSSVTFSENKEEKIFKKSLIEDLVPGNYYEIQGRVVDSSLSFAFYCLYCCRRIYEIDHECFANSEAKVRLVPYLRLLVEEDNTRLPLIVSPTTRNVRFLTTLVHEEVVEDYFIQGESITPVLEYIASQLKGKRVRARGCLYEFIGEDKRAFIVEEIF